MKCVKHADDAGEEVAGDSDENIFLFKNRLYKSYHNGEVTIMPKHDGTGPKGKGSKTGRGQGACNIAGKTFKPQGQGKRGLSRGAGKSRGEGHDRGKRRKIPT